MTNILKDLKDHLPTFKTKNDSFSDVVPKLEESFLKSNENGGKKKGFFKNCKAGPPITTKHKSCQNNSRPKSAGNIKNNNVNNPIPASAPNNRSPNSEGTVIKTRTAGNKPVTNSAKPSTTGSTRSNASSRQSNISNLTNLYRKASPKLEYNPLGVLKAEVQKAIKEKKTFTIKGTFPAVRRALLKRGWVEKIQISYKSKMNDDLKKFQTYSIHELVTLIRNKDIAETCKTLIKSKLLETHQVDLYWSSTYESFKECPDKIKLTKINKFRYNLFSYANKLGLCYANKNSVWFRIPGVANLNHPRTYSLTKDGDTPEFIKDFHRTAAMSLLKWVVKNSDTGEYKVLSQSGKIPIEVFDFAINECYKFIKKAQHEDIDNEIEEALDYEWTEFLNYFYKTVHIGNHFRKISDVTEIDMVRKANFILNKLNIYWPYLEMDGLMNIWILKPIDSSQGVGIHMCRTLQYVLKTIRANPNKRYIIQKYIERPLLIHNTKFDIRQWFLIGGTVPLTIWMYKRCYIRFSSQTYNLRKLHESIHLTNNAVQSRYREANRDIALPSYNMWDSVQFKNYLSDIGYPKAYDTIIYPGMKQCIIAAVLIHQDKLDRRKNCFELYGADFMLTEDFKPWLIEINANPALHGSTPITARMCPLVLEDVIKVVVDYDANKSASTGSFELVYEKNLPIDIKNPNLQVQGTPVTANYFYEPEVKEVKPPEVEKMITQSFPNMQGPDAIDYVKHIGNGMRKTLEDLLLILRKEKEKRHARKNKSLSL
ncbi:tubulin glycylase 3A-like, partial [Anoplophora glabripennis]|uniref:tubulin glycylase 3A-like n=1 Tax=Anoplophora glabripennis TaxID=217634 RepID=UPI000873D34C